MRTADSTPVVVALVQMRCAEDTAANLATALARIAEAAQRGAQIVCLPELFCSRYFCQSEEHKFFALAEPIPGPSTTALSRAAAQHGVAIVGSLFECRAPGLYHNTAVVFDADGSLAGVYRKMHIPDDPLYYEKFYFTPGDLGFRSLATRYASVAPLVCWDQWYPEAARLAALGGAQILFYPTAIAWHREEKAEFGSAQHDAWQTMQRSHAIANGVFVAAANRVGHEGTLEFWGASFIVDPFGRVLARADHGSEEIVLARCDLALIAETRQHWPFLRDRRIDAYGDLVKRYRD
ncbi:MAG: carbon-nitrogen hydrolase [Deltaproteobacteria bacterium]|nr:carbon-nitrogen hydrolase [Deltaproteobacteria bacterium]